MARLFFVAPGRFFVSNGEMEYEAVIGLEVHVQIESSSLPKAYKR
jgi:hypothetical protein